MLAALVGGPPRPVLQTDGRWKLAYELELVNAADVPIAVERLEVLAPGGAPLASLDGGALAAVAHVPGAGDPTTLPPAAAGVFLVNLDFARRQDVPASLAHALTISTERPSGLLLPRAVETVAEVDVAAAAAPVIGPPLRGGGWVAAASCCDSYHRRAVLPVNGRRFAAQRYAIDWLRLDAEGRVGRGDPKRRESFPQYGAEVLAVADARVVGVVDDLPEQTPGEFPALTSLDEADGNRIILDLGDGLFANYAHLQPGSVRVRPGDRVERGQTLALLGNSGNSDMPHLHFHVMDAPSPLAADGVPYVIESFELVGRAVSSDELETEVRLWQEPVRVLPAAAPRPRAEQLPSSLDIVAFPE